MRIYHGSKKIITAPICGHKSMIKDFGNGFYATESEELVRDWAAKDENGGFINIYELDTDGLGIIDLGSESYSVLNWLALILSERNITFSSRESTMNAESIIRRYLPDVSDADIIKGFRADDTNLIFCKAFIEERIDKEKLSELIRTAGLGEQLVLRTEKAFKNLEYIDSEAADGSFNYPIRLMKEERAAALLEAADKKAPVPSPAGDRMHPYPEMYLKYSTELLGGLLAYASNTVPPFPGFSIDRLFTCFIVGGLASCFESGDPLILLGSTCKELYQKILISCGIEPSDAGMADTGPDSAVSRWCGELLAYYQWYKNISFSEILNSLSYGRLFALYPEFHAMPLKEASDLIDSRLSRRRAASTKLQAYRKRFGLSQRELSEASGVNIRTLQQYETGGKDINRAAVEKVISLSRILHCRSERLLE